MRTKLISQNTNEEVVTLEEVMEHSRITDSYDELVVQSSLDAATDLVQQWVNRKLYPSILASQVEEYRHKVTLPFPPIASVSTITAEDRDDNVVTLVNGTHWKFDCISETVRFIGDLKYISTLSNFEFNYSAGYQCADDIPRSIKHAIKMTFATLYENREDTVIGTSVVEVPLTARRVLAAHRVRSHS